MVAMHRAVQFTHAFIARFLVQPVYVLRNYERYLTLSFKAREKEMHSVGLCARIKHFGLVKLVKHVDVRQEKVVRNYLFRIEIAVLGGIQSVCASEIGDTARHGNSCTAQHHDSVVCSYCFFQLFKRSQSTFVLRIGHAHITPQ